MLTKYSRQALRAYEQFLKDAAYETMTQRSLHLSTMAMIPAGSNSQYKRPPVMVCSGRYLCMSLAKWGQSWKGETLVANRNAELAIAASSLYSSACENEHHAKKSNWAHWRPAEK